MAGDLVCGGNSWRYVMCALVPRSGRAGAADEPGAAPMQWHCRMTGALPCGGNSADSLQCARLCRAVGAQARLMSQALRPISGPAG
jgi:hypothetical protein